MRTGRNITHTFTLYADTTLQALYDNLRYVEPSDDLDQLEVTLSESAIQMTETFDCGVRWYKSTPRMVFNKSWTTISKNSDGLIVDIEIERHPKCRGIFGQALLVNFGCIAFAFYYTTRCLFICDCNTGRILIAILAVIVSFMVLLAMWLLSRFKYTNIINLVRESIP